MKKSIFNPWAVQGEVDYERLVKEFGISPLEELPAVFTKKPNFTPAPQLTPTVINSLIFGISATEAKPTEPKPNTPLKTAVSIM